MNKFYRWLQRNPYATVLIASLALLAINIIVIGRWRPFNSDDLYWQQVVHTWKPFSGDTLYLATKDVFVEQVPFFALMEHVFAPSRLLVLVEVLALTLSSFTFFYFSTLYFLKKLGLKASYIGLLPFLWLASFGYPLVQNYLNSNWRSFEVGLCFATFTLVAAILFDDIKPLKSLKTKALSILVAALIGVVIYSDPYYVFFTVGPLLLFVIGLYLLKKIKRSHLFMIIGGTVLSMFFAKLLAAVATKAGIVLVADTPSVFVSFDNIITNIVSSFHGLLIVFNADFFGRPALGLSTLGAMINAAILAVILYGVFNLRKVLLKSKISGLTLPRLWSIFFGLMVAFVFVIYTLTTLVTVNNYRFFIVLIYCAITFLVLILSASKSKGLRLILGALLIGATVYNTALTLFTHNVKQQTDVVGNVGNSANYAIIHAVQSEGLTKGYASYWQANINTYLSGGKQTFLPSLCGDKGKTVKFKWLIDGAQFNKSASRSFYLIDPGFPAPGICSQKQLVDQFGKPQKIIKVLDKSILVYDYDISSKIHMSLPNY